MHVTGLAGRAAGARPEYPSLQIQVDESYGVPPVQALYEVACALQVLHGVHTVPEP